MHDAPVEIPPYVKDNFVVIDYTDPDEYPWQMVFPKPDNVFSTPFSSFVILGVLDDFSPLHGKQLILQFYMQNYVLDKRAEDPFFTDDKTFKMYASVSTSCVFRCIDMEEVQRVVRVLRKQSTLTARSIFDKIPMTTYTDEHGEHVRNLEVRKFV